MASSAYYPIDYKVMSEDEAKLVMEDSRSKDFWAVDAFTDNRSYLQGALDVIYNCVTGNSYNAAYRESQSGARLIVHCRICEKDLSSYDPFLSHENGKSHKKVRQQKLTPKDPNILSNLQSREINAYRGIFPEDSLEDMVDSTEDTILGIQFVYKEEIDGRPKFTCQMCQKIENVTKIDAKNMYQHLKSSTHLKKYLEVKFGFFKISLAEYGDMAQQVERDEGKIHASIVDFTKQLNTTGNEYASANHVPLGKRETVRKSPMEESDESSYSRERDGQCSKASSPPRRRHRIERRRSRSQSWERKSSSPGSKDIEILSVKRRHSIADVGPFHIYDQESYRLSNVIEVANHLRNSDCSEILSKDTEMQEVILATLWTLNDKLKTFFDKNDIQCLDMFNKITTTGAVTSAKLCEVLKDLNIVNSDVQY